MNLEEKIEALHEVAEIIEGEIRDDYSGRGMYGQKCYGIDCYNPIECVEQAAIHGITGANYDQMGRQYIVYWPSIRGYE
ncbi:hypothetical protein P4E94_17855 [Pontiellaceae bacterium B12219]|nr:hypothetical protein [Pontiellaceae bacterium B12219]